MMRLIRLVLFSGVFLLVFQAVGQNTDLRVVDSRTGSPVAFAHVKVTEPGSKEAKYFVTDIDGFVKTRIAKPTILRITYVGYQAYNDTILPGSEPVVRLLPEVFSLDEVVVTAQYNPGSADRSLYRVNVINQMQLRRTAATDLSGILRNQMNVRFTQDAALGTGMSLQGLSGEHVKILVDGVPVIGRLNGSIDLSQVNVQNARQVEIIEGPMSVIYGSNAMAGVVNIIPMDIPGNSISANAGTYLESVGIYNFDGGFSVRKGKNAFGLTAGRNFFGGYSSVDNGRAEQWKPRRQFNAEASHSLTLKKINLKTRVSYFDELLQALGNINYLGKALDNYFVTNRLTAKADISSKGANPFTVSNSLSLYSRERTKYSNNLTIPEKTPIESDTTGFGSFLSRAMYSYRTTSGRLGTQFGYDANYEWAIGERIGNEKQDIADVAAFATMQYQPGEWLSLQPGLRYAWNSRFNSPLIYALHAKAGPHKGMMFRTSFSTGFRAPSLKELYLYFVDVNHNIYGNPDLLPESSTHLQVQASHRIEKVAYATETELRFFLNNINDEITLAEKADSVGYYTYYNLDQSRTMGYSASIRSSLYPMLDLRLGVGSTGRANSFEGEKNMKLYWSPEVTSEVTCRMDKTDLHITVIYKYTGKTTRVQALGNGELAEGYMDAYHNMDLTVLKTFMQKRLSVNAGIRNLFDVTNVTSSGSTGGVHSGEGSNVPVAWGRTFFLKLSFSIFKNEENSQNK
ncbi:MAG: TonB-dependent receptor [Bacteroidales bacterium]|nr:TonB-dependent receptor [Bacteroidales bacterium]